MPSFRWKRSPGVTLKKVTQSNSCASFRPLTSHLREAPVTPATQTKISESVSASKGGVRAQPAIPKNQPLASPSGEVGAPLSNNHPVTASRRVLPSPHPPAGFPDPRSVPLSLWGRKAHLHRKAFLSVLPQSFIGGGCKMVHLCQFARIAEDQSSRPVPRLCFSLSP